MSCRKPGHRLLTDSNAVYQGPSHSPKKIVSAPNDIDRQIEATGSPQRPQLCFKASTVLLHDTSGTNPSWKHYCPPPIDVNRCKQKGAPYYLMKLLPKNHGLAQKSHDAQAELEATTTAATPKAVFVKNGKQKAKQNMQIKESRT